MDTPSTTTGGQIPAGTEQQPTPPAPVPDAPPAPVPPAPTAPQQSADTTSKGNQDQDQAATVARLERELAAARAEAGKTRVTAKQRAADEARQQLAEQLLGILDPSKAGQQATPEQLTQQLAAEQDKARQTAIELAVYRAAPAAGADADALLDSRQVAAALAEVDPSDADAVKAAIEAAVQANPKLAARQQPPAPPRGGSEFNGPPSSERKPSNLTEAIAARLGG